MQKLCRMRLLGIALAAMLVQAYCSTDLVESEAAKRENGNLGGRELLARFRRGVCPDGTRTNDFLCNCQRATRDQAKDVLEDLTNTDSINCQPLCTDTLPEECSKKLECPNGMHYTCILNGCGTHVTAKEYQAIRSKDCFFSEALNSHACTSEISVDIPTYKAVTQGICFPLCEPAPLVCSFPARFGPAPKIFSSEFPSEKKGPCNGEEIMRYNCGCREVTRKVFRRLDKTEARKCTPLCEGEKIDAKCKQQDECREVRCSFDGCTARLPTFVYEAIQEHRCQFLGVNLRYNCGPVVNIDAPGFFYATRGECTKFCRGSMDTLAECSFRARFGPDENQRRLPDISQPPAPPPDAAPDSEETTADGPADSGDGAGETPGSDLGPRDGPAPDSGPADGQSEGSAPDSGPGNGPESDLGPAEGQSEGSAPDSGPENGPESDSGPADGQSEGSAPDSVLGNGPESDLGPAEGQSEGSAPDSGPGNGSSSELGPADSQSEASAPDSGPGSGSSADLETVDLQVEGSAPDSGPGSGSPSELETVDLQVEGSAPDSGPGSGSLSELEIVVPQVEGRAPDLGPGEGPGEGQTTDEGDFIIPVSPPSPVLVNSPEPTDGSVVDRVPGILSGNPDSVGRIEGQSCPCDDNQQVYLSPWMECSQDCSLGSRNIQERSVVCTSASNGFPIDSKNCNAEDIAAADTYQQCESSCEGRFYVQTGPWEECSERCTSFEQDEQGVLKKKTGTMKRELICKNSKGQTRKIEKCEEAGLTSRFVVERPCNSNLCEIALYKVGEWGDCDCSSGLTTRKAECYYASNPDEVISNEFCGAADVKIPDLTKPCTCTGANARRVLLQSTATCDGMQCSGNGKCSSGVCTCNEGFEGPDCQFDNRKDSRCVGMLQANGACCRSSFLSIDGECCGKSQLDAEGNCCEGELDPCGVCGGNGKFLDAIGRCCSTVLDGSGLCCPSGRVDECGVCDGCGASCTVNVGLEFQERRIDEDCVLEAVSSALHLREGLTGSSSELERSGRSVNMTFNGILLTRTSTTKAMTTDLERELNGEEVCGSDLEIIAINRIPLCGNSVCEFGEAPGEVMSNFGHDNTACPGDCPLNLNRCPADENGLSCSGHGSCVFGGSARCQCFLGYEGAACDECALGFFRVPNSGLCHPRQLKVIRRRSGNRARSQASVVGVIIALLVIVLLVLLAALLLRRKKKKADEPEGYTSNPNPLATRRDSSSMPYGRIWNNFFSGLNISRGGGSGWRGAQQFASDDRLSEIMNESQSNGSDTMLQGGPATSGPAAGGPAADAPAPGMKYSVARGLDTPITSEDVSIWSTKDNEKQIENRQMGFHYNPGFAYYNSIHSRDSSRKVSFDAQLYTASLY